MQVKDKKIIVVGGLPNPIGGVTTFLYRLIRSKADRFKEILDLYPADTKNTIPIQHTQLKGKTWALWKRCAAMREERVFFNFSGIDSLLLLSLIPKKNNTWALLLHNGKLDIKRPKPLRRTLIKRALNKMDTIGALSSSQEEFYRSLGFSKKVISVNSYIAQTRPNALEVAQSMPNIYKDWKLDGKKIYVASGYPTKIYQHLKIIETFESINKNSNEFRLALFLYGTDDDGLLSLIKEKVSRNHLGYVFWNEREMTFNSCLANAAGYIRMNTVDSYGIAVADAINFQTPAIASNVCSRYEGAIIVDADDFESVRSFVRSPPTLADNMVSNNFSVEKLLDALDKS